MTDVRVRRSAHKCPGPNCNRKVIDWLKDGVYDPGFRAQYCYPGGAARGRVVEGVWVTEDYGQRHGLCKSVRCKCLCHQAADRGKSSK